MDLALLYHTRRDIDNFRVVDYLLSVDEELPAEWVARAVELGWLSKTRGVRNYVVTPCGRAHLR